MARPHIFDTPQQKKFMTSPRAIRHLFFLSLTFSLSLCLARHAPAMDPVPSPIPPRTNDALPAYPSMKTAPGPVILVKFKPDTPDEVINTIHGGIGSGIIKKFTSIGVQKLQLPDSVSLKEALGYYRARPEVVYAEPDQVVHIYNK